jgi:hypothetical protein
MPGVYDRLNKALEISKRESGISPLDLADLPPNLRKIMRLMLREVVMKYTELCNEVAEMPAANRLSPAELDSALQVLVEQNWLTRYGEGEFTSYRVNLRKRAGSQLKQDIWSALETRIKEQPGGDDV